MVDVSIFNQMNESKSKDRMFFVSSFSRCKRKDNFSLIFSDTSVTKSDQSFWALAIWYQHAGAPLPLGFGPCDNLVKNDSRQSFGQSYYIKIPRPWCTGFE